MIGSLLLVGALALIALIVAVRQRSRIEDLQQQIDRLRMQVRQPRPTVAPPTSPQTRADAAPDARSESVWTSPPAAPSPSPPPPPPPPEMEVEVEEEVFELEPAPVPQAATPVASPVEPMKPATTSEPTPQPARAGLEEKLGMRLFVWIGGIALLLAGIYLVQYTAQRGWLSEQVRVILAAIFGLALVIGGEPMRRQSFRIAQALTGAGVAVLYGCIVAAVNLHHLIGMPLGFSLMVVLTAGAVFLSLRHGVYVALLALIGGFATPAILTQGDPPPGATLSFLLLLEIGLTVVTRRRGWLSISLLTLIAALIWALMITIFEYNPANRVWIGMFIIGTAAVYVVSAATTFTETDSSRRMHPVALAIGALLSCVAMMALLAVYGRYSPFELGMLMLLSAGGIVLARIDCRYLAVPWIAATVAAMLMIASSFEQPPAVRPMAWFTFGFGALFCLGGYACIRVNVKAGVWAGFSAATAVVYVLVARLVLEGNAHPPQWFDWWMPAAAAALLLSAMAATVYRMSNRVPVNALSLGAAALATLALAWGPDAQWLASGWMAIALAAVLLLEFFGIAAMRWVIVWCTALSVAVLIAPGPFAAATIGPGVVFNLLLAQYGLPTVAAGLIAWRLLRTGQQPMAWAMQIVTVAGMAVTAALLIRHGFHPKMNEPGVRLIEWPTYACVWMVVAIALLVLGKRWQQRVLAWTGVGLCWLGVLICLVGAGLASNPIWRHEHVGTWPVLNVLLYVYGGPLLLAVVAAALARQVEELRQAVIPLTVAAMLLGVILVAVEVRHGFRADLDGYMNHTTFSMVELATYVIAWQMLGLLLGIAGRWRNSIVLQRGGQVIALTALAVCMFGSVLAYNPLWWDESVGAMRVFNWLLYLYGLPALLTLAALLLWRDQLPLRVVHAVAALILLFVLISLELRQGFQGAILRVGSVSNAEMYGYSLAWVLFGAMLLVLGIIRRSAAMRYASAAVMVLTIGKVFALDTRHLDGLYRVLSLLGLGVILLGLGYLYQKFVFRRPEREPID
ncbi:MAG: DUF2339 domain-containing protein [Phycisphaeraceae bacterium]|nr:DUF2339 domain-containing protein [Phycisphaeraceae bacterium]